MPPIIIPTSTMIDDKTLDDEEEEEIDEVNTERNEQQDIPPTVETESDTVDDVSHKDAEEKTIQMEKDVAKAAKEDLVDEKAENNKDLIDKYDNDDDAFEDDEEEVADRKGSAKSS